ncbi:MAG: hypothetical protein A2Y40_05425 [Candidatus Margulisbacteria bacterium GWF2_35_9]|nr:MAG: hypothetical protein A2Y40_05425 [Candidatus Margulisbacteria bacterium GWF2_35_9]
MKFYSKNYFIKKISYVVKQVLGIKTKFLLSRYSRFQSEFDRDYTLNSAIVNFHSRNKLHAYMHHYFYHNCPYYIQKHRKYFRAENRGFGEDALHSMWYLLFREIQPKHCLEIGVYRGQVISLWALIAKENGYNIEISGISPFSSIGDSVSTYMRDIDYYEDVLASFKYFDLSPPNLVKALSTDKEAISYISEQEWDLIYIDGSHDFETALADYQLCHKYLKVGGILILDDASLWTDYIPLPFSFGGHPGPSKVAREYAEKEMRFIGAVGHNNIYKKL